MALLSVASALQRWKKSTPLEAPFTSHFTFPAKIRPALQRKPLRAKFAAQAKLASPALTAQVSI
jgi:hypothetical protein